MTENYVENYMKYYVNKYYQLKQKSRTEKNYCQIYVTENCSENCAHCYLKFNKKNELSANEIIKTLEKFIKKSESDNKIPVLDLIGGDPLSKKGIKDILKFLGDKNINYGIKGNPHLVDMYKKDLVKYKIKRYQLSIDGIESTHDFLRSKGSFKKTIHAIRILNELNIPVFIKYTVTNRNSKEIAPLLLYLLEKKLKITGFSTGRYYEEKLDNTFSNKEMKDFFDTSMEAYLKLYRFQLEQKKININIVFKEHLWYPYLYNKKYILESEHIKQLKTPFSLCCSVLSMNTHIIECDGKIYPCAKIKGVEFKNFYKELKEYQDSLKNNSCFNCVFKNVCLGCPAFHKKNPNGLVIDNACFLYKSE
ncbi:radical SAM protein [Psychrilyobacter sp.]|uniref:radical SAM protein n=1 Tax=Psychrilyobacter sp. TaxID=2586924 RepID=UPI0030185CE5